MNDKLIVINEIDQKYIGMNVDIINISDPVIHIKTTGVKDIILNDVRISADEPNISIYKNIPEIIIYPYVVDNYCYITIKQRIDVDSISMVMYIFVEDDYGDLYLKISIYNF